MCISSLLLINQFGCELKQTVLSDSIKNEVAAAVSHWTACLASSLTEGQPSVIAAKCVLRSGSVDILNFQKDPKSFILVKELHPLAKSLLKGHSEKPANKKKLSRNGSALAPVGFFKPKRNSKGSSIVKFPEEFRTGDYRELPFNQGLRVSGPFSQVRILPSEETLAILKKHRIKGGPPNKNTVQGFNEHKVKGISTKPQILRYLKEVEVYGPKLYKYVEPVFYDDGRVLIHKLYWAKTPNGYVYMGGLSIASQNINVSLNDDWVSIGLIQ
ncbi:MAG: hypothetical protein WC863_00175 [Patescibacteria group bacterium]